MCWQLQAAAAGSLGWSSTVEWHAPCWRERRLVCERAVRGLELLDGALGAEPGYVAAACCCHYPVAGALRSRQTQLANQRWRAQVLQWSAAAVVPGCLLLLLGLRQ